jgi:hypothetical protein
MRARYDLKGEVAEFVASLRTVVVIAANEVEGRKPDTDRIYVCRQRLR